MIKLIKYLKNSLFAVLFIVILLIVQAIADLSLPDFTSRIINVGVQQSGIEEPIYQEMTSSTREVFLLLSNDDEKSVFESSYQKEGDNYVLKNNHPDLKRITKNKALLSVIVMETNDQFKTVVDAIKEKLPESFQSMKLIDIIKSLPNQQKSELLNTISKTLEEIPTMFTDSLVIELIKVEYTNLGIDIGQMQSRYVIMAGVKMLGVALLSMVATLSVGFVGSRISAKFAKNIREKLFAKTLNFSTTEIKKYGIASLITRTTNDVQQVQSVMVFALRIMCYAPIVGIGGVLKAISVNAEMAWIILLVIGIAILMGALVIIFALPRITLIQKLVDKLNLISREMLNGVLVVRAFGNQKHEEERFNKNSAKIKKTYAFVNSFFATLQPALMFVMNIVAILIVWKAAHGINNGVMQVGDMLAFIQYVMQIVMAFIMISVFAVMIPRAAVSAKRISEVLETENSVKDPIKPKTFSRRIKGEVEFKDVSFKYYDSDEYVLKDINFKATPGKVTAFIGSTGSGKSTLVSLIPRLFDVTDGEVLVNGLNVREVEQKDLHEKISFIFQKGLLFSGTIAENINLGNKDYNLSTITKAAEIAQASEFINNRSDKYESMISQGGTNVSGGQKQRLSIARAIAKNPEIYIFDDSFSALDLKTDAKLRQAIKDNLKEATILIVTQRVSTIMNADQIIVLNEGQIVGKGTHQELLKNNDVYKEIASSQLSEEELNNEKNI